MPDPIKTPDDLKSSEFDRLRRELLAQFQNGETKAFWACVDDIARAWLEAKDKLYLKAVDTLHRELLQELDRFPLVERAAADVPSLADPAFAAGIRRHAENLVRRSSGLSAEEDLSKVNGAREEQRSGVLHDEGPRDDHEGMDGDIRWTDSEGVPTKCSSPNALLPGPVTLPLSATSISDADDEIFLLYTHLAALKPADDSDAGRFHGLGPENSNEDTLIVRLEQKPPWSYT
ncbi:hypothetical protein B0F90DRAFT_1814782 [Multifurca ochricompacta]|uniref:BOD1/SHG1 domain-containing protein n=1 Tax=Multifurca ochricompacta TaxID=376703 RepID=A0AAD4M8W1_9AGAM|nr:hypothetical protein B0F90DRAFT_1814782 [Multifurca ochricompacta]